MNKARRDVGREEIAAETVRVTIRNMRLSGLITLCRPNAEGMYESVPEAQVSAALKLKDGMNAYAAAVRPDAVRSKPRKTAVAYPEADDWRQHAETIARDVSRSLFDEPFGLKDVYVEPLAYVVDEDEREQASGRTLRQKRRVVHLMGNMIEWATADEADYPVRLLSGDAGYGKSSFAKMFALKLADTGVKVLLVPLHLLSVTVSPREALANAAKLHGWPADLLNPGGATELTVLIFDGLDELAKQGAGGERAAKVFARGVQQAVNDCNARGRRLRVLLCGRPIAAHDASESFQNREQTYHLIPYLPPPVDEQVVTYTGTPIAEHDQRAAWWNLYRAKYNACPDADCHEPDTIPTVLTDDRLREFTAQPLLLFLLAVSYRGRNHEASAGRLQTPPNPFADDQFPERMADVYGWLLGQVYLRETQRQGYDHDSRDEDRKGVPTFDEFRQLLGLLGLSAWHSGTDRTATVRAVEELCDILPLRVVLNKYRECYRVGTLSLFVAFYFKHATRLADAEERFEFNVKPFAEYLAAVGLVTLIEDCSLYLGKPKERGQGEYTPCDIVLNVLRLAGPAVITRELYENVCGEVARRVAHAENSELAEKGKATLLALFNHTLREGMPAEKLNEGPFKRPEKLPFKVLAEQSANAEHALLCLLSACVLATRNPGGRIPAPNHPGWFAEDAEHDRYHREYGVWAEAQPWLIRPTWPSTTAAANLIRRTRKQQTRYWERIDPLPFVDMDLHNQWLHGCDLTVVRLDGAILDGVSLDGARLYLSNLIGASLVEANLDRARLDRARLDRARLDGACLDRTSLIEARLDGACLDGASLIGASLEGASLIGASLIGARLDGACLGGASLHGARLHGARLHGATYGNVRLDSIAGRNLLRELGASL